MRVSPIRLSMVLAAALAWTSPRPALAARVDPALRAALERGEALRACVRLDAPEGGGASEAERCRGYGRAQERFLRSLDGAAAAVTPRHRYRFAPVVSVEIRGAAGLAALERLDGLAAIDFDVRGRGALAESRPMIGADAVETQLGATGAGATVVVLDSGVDLGHPDLEPSVVHAWHFLDAGADQGPGADDEHGHGSNVAGIIVSQGTVAPRGIAPGARLVAIRVLDAENRGWISDWARGVEHAVELHDGSFDADGDGSPEPAIPIDAINLSIATDTLYESPCDGIAAGGLLALSRAVQAALDRGISTFAASGNDGDTLRVGHPACLSTVISVGSVRDSLPDRIASSTNRNAELTLLAPGHSITSAGLMALGGLSTFQGSSQAAPHAAGVACLIEELRPGLGPLELRDLLRGTGAQVLDDATSLVFPRVDALAAAVAVLDPKVEALRCEYVSGERRFWASWAAPSVSLSSLSLSLRRSGAPVHEAELAPDALGYGFGALETGDYDCCVVASVAGRPGAPVCCAFSVAAPRFLRGDANGDGGIDVSDAIRVLLYLFAGADPEPGCLSACDADDDGAVLLVDAIFELNFLFRGGADPDPPFPECGADLSGDALTCAAPPCPAAADARSPH